MIHSSKGPKRPPILQKIPYFLIREICTKYFAKLNFALCSAKFAFREISVHCNPHLDEKNFFNPDLDKIRSALTENKHGGYSSLK